MKSILKYRFSLIAFSLLVLGVNNTIAKEVKAENKIVQVEMNAQQQRVIKGKVKDSQGEPLIGVNVLVVGTTKGTMTDIDGNYSITVPSEDAVLQFSYTGFQKISLPIKNTKDFNVVMTENTQMLGEVVVTAMGIERKSKSLCDSKSRWGRIDPSKKYKLCKCPSRKDRRCRNYTQCHRSRKLI